jgi:hypothetical protein
VDAFRVWVRPLGNLSRVRVDGDKNVAWLLTRLSQSLVFKSSEPVRQERDATCSTFEIPCASRLSFSAFERLLSAIPEVRLMLEPA